MNWNLENTSYIFLLLLIPLLIWRIIYLYQWKQKKINSFADPLLQDRLLGNINLKLFLRNNIILLFVFLFIILALINLTGGGEKKQIKREGIDIVFVLDVSNSMNAQDIIPSRIEKAKKIIGDIISKLGGDRVGVVIFAGQAYSVMPLSNDYGAAEVYLNGINTYLISSQGTNISDAVLEASNMLNNIQNTSKAIILLSDGEAHQGEINEAIKKASKDNINIFTIGIGTTKGAPIPISSNEGYSEYKKDNNGNIVITRLENNSLKKIANKTGGKYFDGDGNNYELVDKVFQALSTLKKKEQSVSYTHGAKQYFPFFIGIALLLLIIISLTNYKQDFNI